MNYQDHSKKTISVAVSVALICLASSSTASDSFTELPVPQNWYDNEMNVIFSDEDNIRYVFDGTFGVGNLGEREGNVIGKRASAVENVHLYITGTGQVGAGITAGWIDAATVGKAKVSNSSVIIKNENAINGQSLTVGADIRGAALYGEDGAEKSDGNVELSGSVIVKHSVSGIVSDRTGEVSGSVIIGSLEVKDNIKVERSVIGAIANNGTVLDGKVEIYSGNYGGVVRGAEGNEIKTGRVEIYGGNFEDVVEGAFTGKETGRIEQGSVLVQGGSFKSDINGAAVYLEPDLVSSQTLKGSVIVEGDSSIVVRGNINGVAGSVATAEGSVAIDAKDLVVHKSVLGGSSSIGDVTKSEVDIKSGTIKFNVYGGRAERMASSNKVTITGGTVGGDVLGGEASTGDVTGNVVEVGDSELIKSFSSGMLGICGNVYGGYAKSGNATENLVMLTNGTIEKNVYGGYAKSGDATNNKIFVNEEIAIDGDVYGGYSNGGNAFSDNVLIIGSNFTGKLKKAANFNTIVYGTNEDSSIGELDITAQIGEQSSAENQEDLDEFVHLITANGRVIFDSKKGNTITGKTADGGFTVGGDYDGDFYTSNIVLTGTHDFAGTAKILEGSFLQLGLDGNSSTLSNGAVRAMAGSTLVFDHSNVSHVIGSVLIAESNSKTYATLDDRNIVGGAVSSANDVVPDKIDADNAVVSVDGKISVEEGAKLYLNGAQAGNTYLFALSGTDVENNNDGWRGDNLLIWSEENIESTNVLLDLQRVDGDTDKNSVMISAIGKANALPCVDIPLSLDQLVDAKLINTNDSAPAGVRFLSRATDEQYIFGGKEEMTRVINSASHIANAGGVKYLSHAGSGLFNNSVENHLSLSRTLQLDENVSLHEQDRQDLWVDVLGMKHKIKDIPVCSGSSCAKPTEYDLDMDMGLLVVGLDRTLTENHHIGLALMGGRGTVDGKGDFNPTDNTADIWGVSLYGGWDKDNWNLMGNASYTHIKNDVTQRLPASMEMGSSLQADVTSHVWSLGVRGEYRYEMTEGLDLLPHVGLRWERLTARGFDTKAAGEKVVRTRRDHQDIWTIPVGIGLQGIYRTDSDWTIRPQADVSALFSFGDLKDKTRVSYTGVGVWDSMSSRIVDKTTVAASIGLDVQKHNKSFGLHYSMMDSSHAQSHVLMGKFVYRFGSHRQRVTNVNTFHFAFDQSDVNALPVDEREVLNTMLDPYVEVSSVELSGHTDRLGRKNYNQKLSEARAQTVKTALLATGLEAEKVTSVGFASEKPVVECSAKLKGEELKACLQPNRRVEVITKGIVETE